MSKLAECILFLSAFRSECPDHPLPPVPERGLKCDARRAASHPLLPVPERGLKCEARRAASPPLPPVPERELEMRRETRRLPSASPCPGDGRAGEDERKKNSECVLRILIGGLLKLKKLGKKELGGIFRFFWGRKAWKRKRFPE